MAMAAPMATATELDLPAMGLMAAWLSPAYPVGAFAYSHGLETAIADGSITDAESLHIWLDGLVHLGAGRTDAILLASAWHSPEDADIEALALALQPSVERRLESRMQGEAFARVTAAAYPAHGVTESPTAYPIAVGRAAAAHGVPLEPLLMLFIQGFVANLVSAAVRLVPLGQTDGQRVVAGLMPTCRLVAAEAAEAPLAALGGFSVLADITSMRHETLPTRLFRS